MNEAPPTSCRGAEGPPPLLWFAEVTFHIRFTAAGGLPPFRGATLRGALGHHLKRLACHVSHRNCDICMLRSRCVYPAIFDGVAPDDRRIMRKYPFVPKPFVLLVEPASPTTVHPGEPWRFGLRLFGSTVSHFPYLAYTMIQIGENGLGRDRVRFEMERVADGDEVLYRHGQQQVGWPRKRALGMSVAEPVPETAAVEFLTPLRLVHQQQLARRPDRAALLQATARRLKLLSYFYGQQMHEHTWDGTDNTSAGDPIAADLAWREFDRYSARQGRKMTLGGIVGRAVYRCETPDHWVLLKAAETVHLGKATTFGFGRIRVSAG